MVKKTLNAANTTDAPFGDDRPDTITRMGPIATSGMQ